MAGVGRYDSQILHRFNFYINKRLPGVKNNRPDGPKSHNVGLYGVRVGMSLCFKSIFCLARV